MKMTENPLKLKRLHHVEFLVGNAKQAAFFYHKAFGFRVEAYAGLETGRRDLSSYVLKQGNATFVVSTPLSSSGDMSEHIRRHGDGARDIAFEVEDVDRAFAYAVSQGAQEAVRPRTLSDAMGTIRHAAIRATAIPSTSLISRSRITAPFSRDMKWRSGKHRRLHRIRRPHRRQRGTGKDELLGGMVQPGLGFHRYLTFDDRDISTEYSALMSIVMSNEAAALKMPINEPPLDERRARSRVSRLLPGTWRSAHCASDRRYHRDCRSFENKWRLIPQGAGQLLRNSAAKGRGNQEDLKEIRRLGILVDRDQEGYLLQIFTEPVEDRPTLFYEIIQRAGSRGFGKGNFRALFEAIEREQARRGNL